MNDIVKILFDECIGAPVAYAFGRFVKESYGESHEIKHIFEYQKAGTPDEIWIPEIVGLGFIVVTGDRGKRSSGKKLPLLCLKYKITHIMFGQSVHTLKSPDKIRVLFTLWNEIKMAHTETPGTRYLMHLGGIRRLPILTKIIISPAEADMANRYLESPSKPDTLF